MDPIIDTAMKIGGGALGGAVLGHVFTLRRERSARRRNFRQQMKLCQKRVEDAPDQSFAQIHTETINIVREECAKVSDDIPEKYRTLFDRVRRAYSQMSERDIASDPLAARIPELKALGLSSPMAQCAGRTVLPTLLQKLIDYAK